MDLKVLKRNASAVKKTLKKLDDGSIMTTKGCSIYIPARYREKNFAQISTDIYILGIFLIKVGNDYSVNNVIAMMKVDPDSINEISMDGIDYIELVFEAGSTVISNISLVMDDKLPYYIYDEFVSKGNVPRFFEYNDLLNLFKSTRKHTGVSFASTPTILHMVLSMIARDKNDMHKFYRHTFNGNNVNDVTYIPITSTTHGANNTTSRLMGAHFKDNLTTALTNPSLHEENFEHNLRI